MPHRLFDCHLLQNFRESILSSMQHAELGLNGAALRTRVCIKLGMTSGPALQTSVESLWLENPVARKPFVKPMTFSDCIQAGSCTLGLNLNPTVYLHPGGPFSSLCSCPACATPRFPSSSLCCRSALLPCLPL